MCGESIATDCLVVTFSRAHPGVTIADLNRIEANKVVIPFSADMLALVNLKEPIDMKEKSLANSVCLPEAKIINNRTEYALMIGWGLVDDTVDSEGRPKFEVSPRVSWTIITQGSFNPESDHIELGLIYAQAPSGGARDCKVSIRGLIPPRLFCLS